MTYIETEMNHISPLKHNQSSKHDGMVIEDACDDSLGAIEADLV